jgi:hypothetical protein
MVDTPNGNVVELRDDDGRFYTRMLTPESCMYVTPEEARAWYRTAKQAGGCICANFPRARKGKVA